MPVGWSEVVIAKCFGYCISARPMHRLIIAFVYLINVREEAKEIIFHSVPQTLERLPGERKRWWLR